MLSGEVPSAFIILGRKALIEQNLLPKVIAGSSMGAIVAGFVGTHSTQRFWIFCRLYPATLQAVEAPNLSQMAVSHSLLDADQLEECISANIRGNFSRGLSAHPPGDQHHHFTHSGRPETPDSELKTAPMCWSFMV